MLEAAHTALLNYCFKRKVTLNLEFCSVGHVETCHLEHLMEFPKQNFINQVWSDRTWEGEVLPLEPGFRIWILAWPGASHFTFYLPFSIYKG